MEGYGRLWNILEGYRIEGHRRSWKVMEGYGRSWKVLESGRISRIFQNILNWKSI